jgi:release factor glutamine methyltransferase
MFQYIKERKTGMPLQQVLGYTEFFGLKIEVNSDVLIPRFETELLVDEVVKYIRNKTECYRGRILDLCTGSGAIAIALKKQLGDYAGVTATDISQKALVTAARNAAYNKANIEFLQGDLFEPLKGRDFQVIVCNPPYIPTADIASLQTEVKDFEPLTALDGGVDGLDYYRRIAAEFNDYLAENGIMFFECGMGQSQEIVKMFNKYRTKIVADYSGIDRIVIVSNVFLKR